MSRDGAGGPRPVAIEARNLDKSFSIPLERKTTLKERAVQPSRWFAHTSRRLEVLRDVSFDVSRGEFFGVVGRNGSGKSTLLKVLASIYALDGGTLRVAGRLAPFIELGVGFNPELTARENVVLNGVMMGLTPTEARSRFDAVIEYAELWEYTELKLKNYSSGMYVRLAFSLMLQVDADILLVDEVLAVGDAAFQRKCEESLTQMQADGTCVVLVTHNMDLVKKHCERAMLIEDGRIEEIGEPEQVAERYLEVVFGPEGPIDPDSGTGEAKVTSLSLHDPSGAEVESVDPGEPLTVMVTIHAYEDVEDVILHLELFKSPAWVRVATIATGRGPEIPSISAGEEVKIRIELENRLASGEYRLRHAVGSRASGEMQILDRAREPARLEITGPDHDTSLIDMREEITVESGLIEISR